jgi:hypothetical protein
MIIATKKAATAGCTASMARIMTKVQLLRVIDWKVVTMDSAVLSVPAVVRAIEDGSS